MFQAAPSYVAASDVFLSNSSILEKSASDLRLSENFLSREQSKAKNNLHEWIFHFAGYRHEEYVDESFHRATCLLTFGSEVAPTD